MNRLHKLWVAYVREDRKNATRYRSADRAFARYARKWLAWYDNKDKKIELQRAYSRARRNERRRNLALRRGRRRLKNKRRGYR